MEKRWWVTLLPSGFAVLLGTFMLLSQIVVQYQGGHPDSTIVYAGTGLALGVPVARVLDGVRNKNGGTK